MAKRKRELEEEWSDLKERQTCLEQAEEALQTARELRGKAGRELLRGNSDACRELMATAKEISKDAATFSLGVPERKIFTEIRATTSRLLQIENEISEIASTTYLDDILASGVPSSAEKTGLLKMQTGECGPLYECCFPASDAQRSVPLTLAHPVFGQFVDDFSRVDTLPDAHVCDFVHDLCFNLLGGTAHYDAEVDMAGDFHRIMSLFLGRSVSTTMFACSNDRITRRVQTDGTVWGPDLRRWCLLEEVKLEKGNTLVQGLQTFGLYIASLKESMRGLLPCFLLEVIGPLIRIGALAFLNKVAWQPLTPFMNCFFDKYDRTDMMTLCRAMLALKKGISQLHSLYLDCPSAGNIRDLPYRLCMPAGAGQEVQVLERRGRKLVYLVARNNAEKRIFKYCRQYGEEVHRHWAAANLAPTLYGCTRIEGGWLEVEMEYLEGWYSVLYFLKDLDKESRDRLRAAVCNALDRALAITVEGSKFAHGDLRPPNIMAKEDEGGYNIKFIDFDWAGKADSCRYPPFMNRELPWHPDVATGKVLKQEHDKWWLEGHPSGGAACSASDYLFPRL